jgi:hypothetical protein
MSYRSTTSKYKSSTLVAGFRLVTIADDLRSPCCDAPVTPQCASVTGDGTAEIMCPSCCTGFVRLSLAAILVAIDPDSTTRWIESGVLREATGLSHEG